MVLNYQKTKLLSIGDQITNGIYRFHSKFRHVINFSCAEKLLAIVDDSVGAGPINIVVCDFTVFNESTTLQVTPKKIVINNMELLRHKSPIYISQLNIPNFDPNFTQFFQNITGLKNFLLHFAQPESLAFLLNENNQGCSSATFFTAFKKRMLEGSAQIKTGNILEGVKHIKGCGYGLTPSGDDFNAGLLLALRFVYDHTEDYINKIYMTSLGNNIFSNNFLYLAKNGFLSEKIGNLMTSLFAPDNDKINARAQKALAIGETSGADFLVGFVFTLSN